MSSCHNRRLCSHVKRFTPCRSYGEKQTWDGAGYVVSMKEILTQWHVHVCVMYFPPMFVERLTRLNKYCKAALINLVPTSKKYFELSRQKSGIATTTLEKKKNNSQQKNRLKTLPIDLIYFYFVIVTLSWAAATFFIQKRVLSGNLNS